MNVPEMHVIKAFQQTQMKLNAFEYAFECL